MTMIIDVIARHGVRGAIRFLLSPQNTTSDRTEKSTPQYVCARKRYENGRKGRTCVYRISDERRKRGGHKVRLYTNVEGVNLDEDERQSFTGTRHTRNCTRGSSTKQKKGRTPPTPDRSIKSKIELQRLDVKPYDLSDERSDRRSDRRPKSNSTAPSQAKNLSSSSRGESVAPRPVNGRKHSRRKPRSDLHGGVGVVERRQSPSRALRRKKASRLGHRMSQERPLEDELRAHCSGALPIPQHHLDRPTMKSAPTRPPRRPRETTIDSTIKPTNDAGNDKSGIVEHDLVNEDKHESVVSEALRSSFRQPGLTPQESSDLVFGTGSKVETRRKQQAGCIDDRIAPDVHEFASQIVRDDPLGEAEKMTEASSPSQKPYASGLENSPLGIREGEIPVESHAQVLANPSRTVTSTWVSRTNLPADALVPQYGNQNRSLKFGSLGGALQVAKHAQESQPFQEQPSHDVSTCKPGMFHAQAVTQFDRFALTAIPGTPPYTPQKGEPSHK